MEARRTRKSVIHFACAQRRDEGQALCLELGAGTWRPFLQERLSPSKPNPPRNPFSGSGLWKTSRYLVGRGEGGLTTEEVRVRGH